MKMPVYESKKRKPAPVRAEVIKEFSVSSSVLEKVGGWLASLIIVWIWRKASNCFSWIMAMNLFGFSFLKPRRPTVESEETLSLKKSDGTRYTGYKSEVIEGGLLKECQSSFDISGPLTSPQRHN